MDPITMLAIASVISGAAGATSGAMSSSKAAKMKEKEIKEMEKKRKADFLSQGLDRSQAAGIDLRKGNRETAQSRAQIMQGIAQNIKLGARGG